MIDWKQFISSNPLICHGAMCFTGTRILVSSILDNLAAGLLYDDILKSYPALTNESIMAALNYASELAKEDIILLKEVA